MAVSSVRSSPSSFRSPVQDSAASRPTSAPGAVGSPASAQKPGGKGSDLMSALKTDGFDVGGIGGKAAELGKVLEGVASVLGSIAQLVQGITQGVQGVTEGVKGVAGAVGGAATGALSLAQSPLQDLTAGMSQAPSLE
ncbi:hypothetical protein [Corallococcus carmarthensis]|uniref:Uncharacterized protein n=1 Tax=Corallococcus carmarthensis TaxID=2316728 RepID=A0A3A8KHP5_9BACT|nr:hypothetical protein [Corallococcus carmarthensis]RKH07728.1 hypothetical protein D7X32_01285 [Corallococcus carmarthensis]